MTAAEKAIEALRDAETAIHSALGMVEEASYLPDWDYLRQSRTKVREALAALTAEQAAVPAAQKAAERHINPTVYRMATETEIAASRSELRENIAAAEERAREARARKEEREACAKLADESAAEAERLRDKPDPLGRDDLARISRNSWRHTAQGIAAAIRARGEA